MLSVVGRNLNETIVGAGPECSLFHWRFGQRENRVVIFDRCDVVCKRAAARLLFAFVVAREIAADLRPALAVIGRLKDAFRRSVKNVGIMRRKHQR